jgi:hypothetical protein
VSVMSDGSGFRGILPAAPRKLGGPYGTEIASVKKLR